MTMVARVRQRRDERGASAVEFGLVLIPMLYLIFGVIQYGWYFYAMQAGSSAVGDAARRIAVGNCQTTSQVQGVIFNSIKTGVDIEVPKMRMQLRMNQFRTAKRVASTAKIFDTQIRDAMIVRRAVALGLPVALVSAEATEAGPSGDNVITDYRKLAGEIVQQVQP